MSTVTKNKLQASKKISQKQAESHVFHGITTLLMGESFMVGNNHIVKFEFVSTKEKLGTHIALNTNEKKIIEIPRNRSITSLIIGRLWELKSGNANDTGRYITICVGAVNSHWKERSLVKEIDATSLMEKCLHQIYPERTFDGVLNTQDFFRKRSTLIKPFVRYFMFSGNESEDAVKAETITNNGNNYLYGFSGYNFGKELKKVLTHIANDLYKRYEQEDGLGF